MSFHVPLLQAPSLLLTLPIISICTTPSNIYCIQCSNGKNLLKRETGRGLSDRIRDHLYDTGKNDQSKSVSRHFNSSNHSISDFVACCLSVNGGNDCRKTKRNATNSRFGHSWSPRDKWTLHFLLTFCFPGIFLSF